MPMIKLILSASFYMAIMAEYIVLCIQIHCCYTVAQSCLSLCDSMDCSTPGFPVIHQLLELAQTHVHQVSYAVQPSHPLLTASPPAFNLSQLHGLFQ